MLAYTQIFCLNSLSCSLVSEDDQGYSERSCSSLRSLTCHAAAVSSVWISPARDEGARPRQGRTTGERRGSQVKAFPQYPVCQGIKSLGLPLKLDRREVFMGLFERQSYRDRWRQGDKELFHSLIHHDPRQGRARLQPGTRNSLLVSHIGGRGPSSWAIFCSFPAMLEQSRPDSGTRI